MINRLQGYHDGVPPPLRVYVVSVLRDDFSVTDTEAGRIMDGVAALGEPWIRFTDLHGSTVYARAEYVTMVREAEPGEQTAVLNALHPREKEAPHGTGRREEE